MNSSVEYPVPQEYPVNQAAFNASKSQLLQNFVTEFTTYTKDFMNNAYLQSQHIYYFKVNIRPANWIEALNYNAFPFSAYILIMFLILLGICITLFSIFLIYSSEDLIDKMKIKIEPFHDKQIKTFKFFILYLEKNKHVSRFFIDIVNELGKSLLILGAPCYLILFIFIFIFFYSGLFKSFPNNYIYINNLSSVSDLDSFYNHNNISRFGFCILIFGLYLFYIGSFCIKPNYEKDLIAKNLVKKEEIRTRYMERINICYKLIIINMLLIIYGSLLQNLSNLSSYSIFGGFLFYEILFATLIENIFYRHDNLEFFAVKVLLSQAFLTYLVNMSEINLILVSFILSQLYKYLKFYFMDDLQNKIYNRFMEKYIFKSQKDLFIEKMINEDIDHSHRENHNQEALEIELANKNIKKLNLIIIDFSNNLLNILNLGFIIFINFLFNTESNSSIENILILLFMYSVNFVLDIFNYYLIIRINKIQYGN